MKNTFRLSRPLNLLLAALTYILGASVPAYLGIPIQIIPFVLGLASVLFSQASMALLGEVFRPHNEPLVDDETPQQKETLRNNMLYVSIGMIATIAFIAFIIYINSILTLSSFLFFLSSVLLALAYAIPPVRLMDRGFGELILAAHIAYVVPTIGFLLQAGENHRLLFVLATPLIALGLAYFLILNFVTFQTDQKYQRGTLLRRLTWEHAVPLHHSLIVFAYVIYALAPMLGFSFNLIWPAFLTLPFAVFQIFQLSAITNGSTPNWKLLTSTALAVFGLTTYFLTLTFWLR
ncbi:MAG: UbiA family prenyltransferase [Anaerolineales bacterium]|nr:UbiA family prenyltransferase [Anaerolineales bacterium]